MKYVYVVFSSTPGKMGRFIRMLTPGAFNHVSIMFGEKMEEAYTFGRMYVDTPFWGGIVKDSVSRYTWNKKRTAFINVCRIETEDEKFHKAHTLVRDMFSRKEDFPYNFFSAIVSIFKKRIFIENAYTCVEFCSHILSILTPRVKDEGFYSVKDLFEIFEEDSVYQGDFNLEGNEDVSFNVKKGKRVAWRRGICSIFELFKRMRRS